jgi:hypothetical protein
MIRRALIKNAQGKVSSKRSRLSVIELQMLSYPFKILQRRGYSNRHRLHSDVNSSLQERAAILVFCERPYDTS